MVKAQRSSTDLLHAVERNNVDDVKRIMQTRMKKRNRGSASPNLEGVILAAAGHGDTTILRYLIDAGIDANASPRNSNSSSSPLHVAVSRGLVETMSLLLASNADVNRLDHKGRTALHIAVKRVDCQMARMLLSRGCSVHVSDRDGATPLQIATRYGHVELVRLLLEHNANVFQPGQRGESLLHIAAMQGHVPLVDLFSRYVDVNIKATDAKGRTALHLAAERGLVETVRFMVERLGADVNALNAESETPLHAALQRPHDHTRMRKKEDFDVIAQCLLSKDFNLQQQDCRGNTVLHLAAEHQYRRIVENLLMSGADPKFQNKCGRTAKDLVPEFDAGTSQLFVQYAPFSSSYISSPSVREHSRLSPNLSVPAPSVEISSDDIGSPAASKHHHSRPSTTVSIPAATVPSSPAVRDPSRLYPNISVPTPFVPISSQVGSPAARDHLKASQSLLLAVPVHSAVSRNATPAHSAISGNATPAHSAISGNATPKPFSTPALASDGSTRQSPCLQFLAPSPSFGRKLSPRVTKTNISIMEDKRDVRGCVTLSTTIPATIHQC